MQHTIVKTTKHQCIVLECRYCDARYKCYANKNNTVLLRRLHEVIDDSKVHGLSLEEFEDDVICVHLLINEVGLGEKCDTENLFKLREVIFRPQELDYNEEESMLNLYKYLISQLNTEHVTVHGIQSIHQKEKTDLSDVFFGLMCSFLYVALSVFDLMFYY